jgi:NAD(P)-dependent dehydrogenase (short-subunit alcohol dehydrogenase family)
MTEQRIWLITGTSSGLGRALVEAAAEAGDLVVATARRPEAVDDLIAAYPSQIEGRRLDVTDSAAIAALVAEVEKRYGRIDVLVNNAGHGYLSAAEETPAEALRELFELHLFGPAALVGAVLPGMRARRRGAIVQMSSVGGRVPFPGFSGYCASKFALEGYSETLATEVAPLGIQVLIVEPGSFRTDFCGDKLQESRTLPDYQDTAGQMQKLMKGVHGVQDGDPVRAAQAILLALAAPSPPLRLPLGDDAVDLSLAKLDLLAAELREWESLSRSTGFEAAVTARA